MNHQRLLLTNVPSSFAACLIGNSTIIEQYWTLVCFLLAPYPKITLRKQTKKAWWDHYHWMDIKNSYLMVTWIAFVCFMMIFVIHIHDKDKSVPICWICDTQHITSCFQLATALLVGEDLYAKYWPHIYSKQTNNFLPFIIYRNLSVKCGIVILWFPQSSKTLIT